MNTMIAQLRLMGKTISLSAGVPIINRPVQPSPTLHLFSEEWGEAEIPLDWPALGPDQPGWHDVFSRRAGDSDQKAWEALGAQDPAKSVPFVALSSPSLFWVEDKKGYTHILMDIRDRRMVGVKPFWPEELEHRPRPWALIRTLCEDPEAVEQPPLVDRQAITWERQQAEVNGRIYTCLHPAPVGPSGCALWAFDGLPWVAISRTGPAQWEEAFNKACEVATPDPRFIG